MHQGFYQTLSYLESELDELLNKIKENYELCNPDFQIMTGHSLGGALAMLATSEIAQAASITTVNIYTNEKSDNNIFKDIKEKTKLITFG